MRIVMAQCAPTLGAVDANLAAARRIVDEVAPSQPDVVIFPELFATGYSLGDVDADLAMVGDDSRLLILSRPGGPAVIIGFQESRRGLRTFNSAAYLAEGAPLHIHHKLYLPTYGHFEERKHFNPGQSMRAFDTAAGRVAMMICNDAWQPQLAFLAIQDGAEVLIIIANSAVHTRPEVMDTSEYWHDLTRFCARMFQCFVVFVNRVGTEGPLRFWGGSHVVDPWGRIVAQAPMHEANLTTADIDLDRVRHRRQEIPLVREARLQLLVKEATRLADDLDG